MLVRLSSIPDNIFTRNITPQTSETMTPIGFDAFFIVHSTTQRFTFLERTNNADDFVIVASGSGCEEGYSIVINL
jgi:hypothetical protein